MAAAPCSAVGVGVGNERLERGRRRGNESVALLSPPIVAKEGCGGKGRRKGWWSGGRLRGQPCPGKTIERMMET